MSTVIWQQTGEEFQALKTRFKVVHIGVRQIRFHLLRKWWCPEQTPHLLELPCFEYPEGATPISIQLEQHRMCITIYLYHPDWPEVPNGHEVPTIEFTPQRCVRLEHSDKINPEYRDKVLKDAVLKLLEVSKEDDRDEINKLRNLVYDYGPSDGYVIVKEKE